RRGHELYYTAEPAVWHRIGASTPAGSYRYEHFMERNRLLFAYRQLDDGALDRVLRDAAKDAAVAAVRHPLGFLGGRDGAMRARRVLDDVHVGDAETPPPASWPPPDCVIFADVLEHLVDPWKALAAWRARLAPGGKLLVSIPNVLHRSVVSGALAGRWDYE